MTDAEQERARKIEELAGRIISGPEEEQEAAVDELGRTIFGE